MERNSVKSVKPTLSKNGNGFLSTLRLPLTINEARLILFVDENDKPKELVKIVDADNQTVTFALK